MKSSRSFRILSLTAVFSLLLLLTAMPESLPTLKFRIAINGTTELDISLKKFSDPACLAILQFSKEKNFAADVHSFTLGSAIFKNASINFQLPGIPYDTEGLTIKSIYSRLYFDCSDSADTSASFYSAVQTLKLSKITKARKIQEEKFFSTLIGRVLSTASRKSRSEFISPVLAVSADYKAPVIITQLFNKNFLQKQDIVFRFAALGARSVKYDWHFTPHGSAKASKLKQKFGLEIISDSQGSTLIIRSALIDTSAYSGGTLNAVASNKYGKVESDTAQITVNSDNYRTPVPVVSNTPAYTATRVASATATVIKSPTPTKTVHISATATRTSAPTMTKTAIPSFTATYTRTSTAVATATRTLTPTKTKTATPVITATLTATSSATPTSALTPSATSSPTITPTSGSQSASNSCKTISQYGVTWTFDKNYDCGQFYNGDWWVKGPVVITEVNPKPDYQKGRNGSYINPDPDPDNTVTSNPNSKSNSKQPYDSRPNSESHPGSNATASYSADYGAFKSLPQTVSAQSSIVSSISGPEIGTNNDAKCGLPGDKGLGLKSTEIAYNFCDTASIKTAAVLTVLSSVPADNGKTLFRPPYAGTRKPMYSVNSINFNLIPSVAMPAGANYSIDEYIRSTGRVHLDHTWDHPTRNLHPYDNMPAYGSAVARLYGDALLIAATSGSEEKRRKLASNLIQIGIDNHELVRNGQKWPANGGHSSGRKIVILFAGMMLGNSEILATGQIPINTNTFSEDCQVYGSESSPSYGLRYCSRGDTSSSYRTVNANAWRGQVLAAENYIDSSGKSLRDYWNHPAVFAWVHKWYNNKGNDLVNHRSAIADAYWAQYQQGFPKK